MRAHLFRGPGRVFAVTTESSGANLPARYAPWALVKSLDIHPGEPQGGLDVDECLIDLERYGAYLTDAHVRIPPEESGLV